MYLNTEVHLFETEVEVQGEYLDGGALRRGVSQGPGAPDVGPGLRGSPSRGREGNSRC